MRVSIWGCFGEVHGLNILGGLLEVFWVFSGGCTGEGVLGGDSLGGILERVAVRGGSSGRLTQPLAAYLSH